MKERLVARSADIVTFGANKAECDVRAEQEMRAFFESPKIVLGKHVLLPVPIDLQCKRGSYVRGSVRHGAQAWEGSYFYTWMETEL